MARFPAFLALAGLALSGCASVQAPHRIFMSQWAPSGIPKEAAEQQWVQLPQDGSQDMVIKVANDKDNLYVLLAANARAIKCQLLGAYHQSLNLVFESGDPQHPLRRGLSIAFHHLPGASYPQVAAQEPLYWKAATLELAELAPGLADYPKSLIPKTTDLGFDSDMAHGQLTYFLRLPLHSDASHVWSLEAPANGQFTMSLETSPIDPQAAYLELVREYRDEIEGWGWQGQSGYGPDKELRKGKAFGMGHYDNWGLDQSIYAQHGMYAPQISPDAVPTRLVFDALLQLAPEPALAP